MDEAASLENDEGTKVVHSYRTRSARPVRLRRSRHASGEKIDSTRLKQC